MSLVSDDMNQLLDLMLATRMDLGSSMLNDGQYDSAA